MSEKVKVQDLGIVSAVVTKITSITKKKSNGGESRLCTVTITEDGHAYQGMGIFANRTTINREGKEKDMPEVGDEIKVGLSFIAAEDSTSGKEVNFAEIFLLGEGESIDVASADDLAKARAAAQTKA